MIIVKRIAGPVLLAEEPGSEGKILLQVQPFTAIEDRLRTKKQASESLFPFQA